MFDMLLEVTITFGVRTVVRVFVNKVHYAKSRYSANNTECKGLRIIVKRNYKINSKLKVIANELRICDETRSYPARTCSLRYSSDGDLFRTIDLIVRYGCRMLVSTSGY